MAYLPGYKCDVYLTAGASVAFNNEATTGNTAREVYTINDTAKRFWDEATAVAVEKDIGGGYVAVDAADYTVNYAGGQIVFLVALPLGAAVRVDGGYFAYSALGQSTSVTLNPSQDTVDVTVFGDVANQGWHMIEVVMKGGTVTLERFWYDETFNEAPTGLFGLKIMPDFTGGATAAWYCYGKVSSASLKMAVGAIMGETLNFNVHGNIAYIA